MLFSNHQNLYGNLEYSVTENASLVRSVFLGYPEIHPLLRVYAS